MIFHVLLISFVISALQCDKPCSREDSRLVREYFLQILVPIYERNHLTVPVECIFFPVRDLFYQQELHKTRLTNDHWLCQYCNRTFSSESHLDIHLTDQHSDALRATEQSVCLADYCSIFRCDVLKQSKAFVRSRKSSDVSRQRTKKVLNEQQLIILRTRCASLINQCIPSHLHHNVRVQIQHNMYAEICAYLTNNNYLELPTDRKPLISLTTFVSLIILIGLCWMAINFIRRSASRFRAQDDDESEKHLSDETISTATALLSTAPANGIIHSPKSPPATIRHRVRFQPLEKKFSSPCERL